MARRDRWVAQQFPAQRSGFPSAAARVSIPDSGLMEWTNDGPVLAHSIAGKPLQIAGEVIEHGIYTVQDLDGGEARTPTGQELAEGGLQVSLADCPGAALLVYRRAR
ncbi:MAG: hypothetical protein AB1486_28130 [Planctomycetota bacterium]